MSIAVTGLPSCARGLVSAPAPAPSSRIGPFVAVTRAVILLIVGVWVRKFWPSSCRPPWDERGMFALQERRMKQGRAQRKNGCARSPFRDANGLSDGRRAKRSAKRAVRRGGRGQQACASQRTRKSSYPYQASYQTAGQVMWSAGIAHDWSQAACWPVTAWVAAEGGALELVELPRPLRCHPPHLFVFEAVGLDAPRSVVGRKAAEFVGFGARQGSSREGVASGTLWVD